MLNDASGDGLGMLPRPGEPESGLQPGMSAVTGKATRSRAEGAGALEVEQAVSLPLDTSIGPVALEQPASWNYDFDPGTGLSRATFSGEVSFASGGSATAGVTTFNTRSGAVTLLAADVTGAGGAPANNPSLTGTPLAPTAPLSTSTTQIATTAFVQQALNATPLVSSFNGRNGAITLSTSDVTGAGGAPAVSPALTGTPTTPTAMQGNASSQIASTQFVANAIASGSVISWNGRTGAVNLSINDLLSVGGAPIASPSFTGAPLGPTAAPGTATTQLATTAFVTNAVTGATSGVASFNTRTGAVVLTATDITSAGGALIASPTFTGTPQSPTASAGTNNNQIATTAFVATAFGALSPTVQSFNGRTGVVSLNLADVTSVGGAPLASPTFSGTVSSPTPAPLDNSTRVSTTAFVDAAILGSASGATPLMDGVAVPGTATAFARGDHVHPVDTSRYAASNPSGYQTAAQVTASLGSYLPLTGGTITGNLSVNGALSNISGFAIFGLVNSGGYPTLSFTTNNFIQGSSNTISIAATGALNLTASGFSIAYASGNFYPAVNNSGGCGIPGNAWFQVASYNFPNESDPRAKEAMRPAPAGALRKVKALAVHQFRYKSDASKRVHIGFNADEVEQLHPHAVFIGEDAEQMKAINLPDMIALLWQAVQELTAQVERIAATSSSSAEPRA
jgi:hypothetical protein